MIPHKALPTQGEITIFAPHDPSGTPAMVTASNREDISHLLDAGERVRMPSAESLAVASSKDDYEACTERPWP